MGREKSIAMTSSRHLSRTALSLNPGLSKTVRRRRVHRSGAVRIAALAGAAGLALTSPAHALNIIWMGGGNDDWDGTSAWNVLYLNSNDESFYDTYFGDYTDNNGIVTGTGARSPSSLNFANQNWTLELSSLSTGTTATALYLNVSHTSPVVNLNCRSGISWGNEFFAKFCDINVETGSVLNINVNVYGRGSLNKYGGGAAVITSPVTQTLGSVIPGTNVFGGTLVTDNPINDYNVRAGATMAFEIPTDNFYGARGDLTYAGNIYGEGSFVKKGGAKLTMTQDVCPAPLPAKSAKTPIKS